MQRVLAVLILTGCASAPQEVAEVAPTYPQIKVIDHDCNGNRLRRLLIQITPGSQPNQAIVTVAPSVCADAI